MNFEKVNIFIDMSNTIHRTIHAMIKSNIDRVHSKEKWKSFNDEEKKEIKLETAINLEENLIKHTIWRVIESFISLYETKQENRYLVFDSTSWRRKFIEEHEELDIVYKGGRNKDLNKFINKWIDYMENNLEKTNFNKFKIDNLEADEHIIALLCKRLNNPSEKNVVISNDEDFKQLMKLENTFIYNPFTKSELELTQEQAQREFLTKVTTGDSSDNIPSILPNEIIVDVPKRKRGENGMEDVIEKVNIASIQFGDKTVKKILLENNNNIDDLLIQGREKIFKKQSKKNIVHTVEDIKKILEKNFYNNKSIIDFDEIPNDLVEDFDWIWEQEFKKKNFTNEEISKFYKNEELFKLSEKYEVSQPNLNVN